MLSSRRNRQIDQAFYSGIIIFLSSPDSIYGIPIEQDKPNRAKVKIINRKNYSCPQADL